MHRLKKFCKSFFYAIRGILLIYGSRSEINFKVQSTIGVFVILLGWAFNITTIEWLFVTMCIGMVLSLELMNSSIEKTLDKMHPTHSATIGNIKDITAGAVLISAISSAICGIVIFLPYIDKFVNKILSRLL